MKCFECDHDDIKRSEAVEKEGEIFCLSCAEQIFKEEANVEEKENYDRSGIRT